MPISIHAAKLDTQSFEKIAELDRRKNNWSDWSFAMKLALNQHLVGGYLLGTIKAPDTVLEPSMFNNWMLNNITIVSALCSRVSHEDQIGIPTEEVFLSIAMLNALSGKVSAVQTQVASLLSLSSKDRPFTSANIRAQLDTEQQLLDNEKAHSADITLAASMRPKYGSHSHGGRHDEVLAKIRTDKMSNQGKANSLPSSGANTPRSSSVTSSNPLSVRYDNSGCAYIVDSVTGGAVFLTSAPPVPTPTAVPSVRTSEFAGLAQDSTPVFLHTLSNGDQSEFDALMVHLGDLRISVDWCRHNSPVDFANLSIAAPDQHTNMTIDPSIEPFFINMGVSVHISNTTSNFYSLRPIPPRVVNGIGGSGTCALGIGNI
ncbi:hypothetical protein PAXRUDRAFT_12723 [Paxillus rubicundulus Ve08.2h10]|uniref:Uncharacterized protein n=1 Tax=Paxillus rubicundulus Ve08.2h10 TaxID=930991 RepID=A0A0D0D8M8_9AGAM|nr:hypothetical protein PAXRUDRAFT_12723 [Paxillus rubicundulus Ve08.2h10]